MTLDFVGQRNPVPDFSLAPACMPPAQRMVIAKHLGL
jgi:hypothetical protein